MKDEPTNFKVTDRRLFNPDGTPRDVPPEEKPEPKPVPVAEAPSVPEPQPVKTEPTPIPASAAAQASAGAAPAASASTTTEEEEEEELLDADDPAGFVNFVMSIASNAASSLGMMEHPVTHKREVDLELAKHWIDVLGMLEKKTKGNLQPQEDKILEGLLADLRMQFVSLTSTATPKSAGFTGRDVVGG